MVIKHEPLNYYLRRIIALNLKSSTFDLKFNYIIHNELKNNY